MKKEIKEGMVILGIFLIFVFYLFLAANRFENLEKNNKKVGNDVINISE